MISHSHANPSRRAMSTMPPALPISRPPGWWTRNWKWFVPVMALSVIALFVVMMVGVLTTIFGAMKNTEPYKDSVAKALANPQVQAALGQPIKSGLLVTGNIQFTNSTGQAVLDIPLKGSRAEGNLHVEGTSSGGVWTYVVREVRVSGTTEKIPLSP